MPTTIQPVSKENWYHLVKLKVREDQKNFVAPNVISIAESQFGYDEDDGTHWDLYPFGIYDNDTPVGFLMYGFSFQRRDFQALILRLMVDENHQGRGYGKFGMEQMLDIFRKDERIECAGISYESDNEVARKLYASLGFVETGGFLEGEVLAVCKIR